MDFINTIPIAKNTPTLSVFVFLFPFLLILSEYLLIVKYKKQLIKKETRLFSDTESTSVVIYQRVISFELNE